VEAGDAAAVEAGDAAAVEAGAAVLRDVAVEAGADEQRDVAVEAGADEQRDVAVEAGADEQRDAAAVEAGLLFSLDDKARARRLRRLYIAISGTAYFGLFRFDQIIRCFRCV
jgi:hypothetical protein